MSSRYFAFIFLIFLSFIVVDSQATIFKPDSLFLKPFPKKISVRTMVGIKEFSIAISNSQDIRSQAQRITYKPNNGLIGGIGISYKNLLVSYFYRIPGTELNTNRYGTTTIVDFQINLTTRYVHLSGFNKTFDGFYVAKPKESYPAWEAGTPNPLRSDIKFQTKGLETIISFNPRKYSLNASLKFTEQQLKSVFSPLLYANVTYIGVKADSSLIPSHLKDLFFDGKELIKSDFSGWTLQPGVAYSFVRNNWFFNPMVFAGFGYLQKDLIFSNQAVEEYKDYYFRVSTRLSCGYNGRLFFYGVLLDWNEMFLPEKNLMIRTENFNVMLVAGFRF
ncbi:MAG: DUF4421 family protein [Tenuifilaceae bacterium]